MEVALLDQMVVVEVVVVEAEVEANYLKVVVVVGELLLMVGSLDQ